MGNVSVLRAEDKPLRSETRIDLGCGAAKKAGFAGVDRIEFAGVDVICDLGSETWPWADSSVEEAHSSHFVEHLEAVERVHFYNELFRVLAPRAKCLVVTPHWASNRAYGDPTHKWPPVSEMSFFYLSREWRKLNAPHTDVEHWPLGYTCDFEVTYGYGVHNDLLVRPQDYQMWALQWCKEAATDTHATLIAKK